MISNFRHVLNVVFNLLGDSPASEFYMPTFWNTVCSTVISRVSRKNNWDETVGVFIWEKVWLQNNLSQLEQGGMERGHVKIGKQAMEGKDPKGRTG